MHFARGTKAFCASDEHVGKALSNFIPQRLSNRTSLKIATHLRKRVVATLSYSPVRTLCPQAIYAIAFSARLNGLQVDYVDKENNKRTSPCMPTKSHALCVSLMHTFAYILTLSRIKHSVSHTHSIWNLRVWLETQQINAGWLSSTLLTEIVSTVRRRLAASRRVIYT